MTRYKIWKDESSGEKLEDLKEFKSGILTKKDAAAEAEWETIETQDSQQM